MLDLIPPGEILWEDFMEPMGLSINRLARDLVVPFNRISDIVNGKRSITADTALRFSKFFGNSAKFWLGLQNDYDIEEGNKNLEIELSKIETVSV